MHVEMLLTIQRTPLAMPWRKIRNTASEESVHHASLPQLFRRKNKRSMNTACRRKRLARVLSVLPAKKKSCAGTSTIAAALVESAMVSS